MQWRRSIVLGDTLRLLTDAQSVMGVPSRLEQLTQSKASSNVSDWGHRLGPERMMLQDWVTAVNMLLTSCNKLARQELSGVWTCNYDTQMLT